ncbi:hypothetical protein PFISCL1PPCAC_28652, partial [Pristionchus fissidentatus]
MVAEKDRALFEFFALIETTNIMLSFISNTYLIYIILKSSKELGGYRFLLLAFAINDIYFPLIHFLTLPVICSYRDAFIMFSKGILTSKFSICLFAATFSQTMPIMAHLFIYRLIVLKWLNIGGASSAPYLSRHCWFNYHSDDELQAYVKPFLDSDFPGEGEGHIGALYYNDEGLRFSAVLTTMGFNSIMCFWSVIIFTCSVQIVLFFRLGVTAGSRKTHQMQRHMFRTLVLQMIVPIVCVYMPCAGIINFPIFFPISVFPNFVTLTLFPLIDAIITLLGELGGYRFLLLAFAINDIYFP